MTEGEPGWVQSTELPLTKGVTSGKLLHPSVLYFAQYQVLNIIYCTGKMLWVLYELIDVSHNNDLAIITYVTVF